MLDLFPDSEYDTLISDIEHIVSFLPIEVSIEEMAVDQLWIRPINRDSVDEGHMAALAEYLRMSKRSISEIKEIEGKIREAASKSRMPVFGLERLAEYLESLMGEMAMQDAFPNRAPSWRLYHIDPSDPWRNT